MARLDMLTTHGEAVLINHVFAHGVTFGAGFDAFAKIVPVEIIMRKGFVHRLPRYALPILDAIGTVRSERIGH